MISSACNRLIRFKNSAGGLFLIAAVGGALAVAACTHNTGDPLFGSDADGANWAAFGRTYDEGHFSPLDEINQGNVGRLKLAWYYDLPMGNSVSGPLAVDGVLYTATGYSVVRAFDGATGKLLWEHDTHAAEAAGNKLRQGWGIRGLAYWNNRIFVGTQDGRLIALQASDGQEIWSQITVGKDDVRFISGPPRVFDGKVIIGHGGADVGPVRGYVTTFDAMSGKQLWRFYTVPGNPAVDHDETTQIAAKSWSGEWWKYGGGGTVWNAMTYDPDTDTILLGTGNGAPWNYRIRSESKGDNLFLCSIVALDAKTGKYKWHYQTNPGESWDYNAAMDMQLAELTVDGKPRKVLMTAPKNGFYYVIDRTNGKLISAEPIVKVNWASKIDIATGRPVEQPHIRYENNSRFELSPGPNGAHNWLPMSYDPRTHVAFIPVLNQPGTYDDRGIDPKTWNFTPGGGNNAAVNIDITSNAPGAGTSELIAWDVLRQRKLWSVPNPGFWNGGTMATAGDLVFQGHADGSFNAYATGSGKKVWSFYAQTGVLAPPITFLANGRQYVTVLSGFGSSGALFGNVVARFGWDARTQPRRVLTFALDGDAKLPPAPPKYRPELVSDLEFRPNPALAAKGAGVAAQRCIVCHGVAFEAAGLAPDLRTSSLPANAEAFNSVVREGALASQGMPSFGDVPAEDIAAVRQYIRTVAHDFAGNKKAVK
jgi:quinohemoprotein ethanol dehydrogenase